MSPTVPTPGPKQQNLAYARPTDGTLGASAPVPGGSSVRALVPFPVPVGDQLPPMSPQQPLPDLAMFSKPTNLHCPHYPKQAPCCQHRAQSGLKPTNHEIMT